MTKLEIAAVMLSPFTLMGMMTALGALLASLHKRRVRKLELHPMSQRRANNAAQVLLDEPPEACPECAAPVIVSRSAFTPDGADFQLAATEHFACADGHRWFGPNQAAVLAKRIEQRRKLKVVKTDKPKAEERLAAKLAELSDACEDSGKDEHANDSDDRDHS